MTINPNGKNQINDLETHFKVNSKDYTINNENELINKYIEEIKDSIRDICADDLKDVKPTDLYKHVIELTSIKPFQEKMRPIPVAKKQEFIIANGMLVGLVDELISPIDKLELKNLYTL